MNTRELGKQGEEAAANLLLSKGYKVLERNYTTKLGEIDLVAEDKDGTRVFVEVKTAYTDAAGDPASWVNAKKQHKMGRVATAYLALKNLGDIPCRFDVIGVTMKAGRDPEIVHYENAFMLTQGSRFLF